MADDWFVGTAAAVLGLAVGSFLNVVVYRLPQMIERRWAPGPDQGPAAPPGEAAKPFNIATPGSHCPHCGHALSWAEKIPVFSFLALQGRCRHCQTAIGWRYLAIELLTGGLFVWSYATHGLTPAAWAWAGFGATLLTLAAIDADTRLLPDALTQPLVWAGLLVASWGLGQVDLATALWGAVGGYGVLWSVSWLFKWLTGKEGMGQGDFKLLAAMGAWLGWPSLLSLVLIASLTGIAGGLWLRFQHRLSEDGYIPFGPFLALAGLWVMAFGPLPLLPL